MLHFLWSWWCDYPDTETRVKARTYIVMLFVLPAILLYYTFIR